MYVLAGSEGIGAKKNGSENLFSKITADNAFILEKAKDIQIWKMHRTPNRHGQKRASP